MIKVATTLSFLFLTACSPQMMRNPTTGQVDVCRLHGDFPIINRASCIDEHENKGWVRTDEDVEKKRQDAMAANNEKNLQAYVSCVEALKNNPSLQSISGKIAIGGVKEQSFSYLTNTNKPNDDEKAAIHLYADNVRKCRALSEKYLVDVEMPTSVLAAHHSTSTARENLLAALYSDEITYGDYAKRTKEVHDNEESAMAQIIQELQRNASEAQARAEQIAAQNAIAQASQAFSSSMAASAAMMNATKPNRLNCTTSSFGSSMQTDCY